MSTTRFVAFDRLGGHELDAWHRLRSANPHLDSPYFHPGFAEAVHGVGGAVQVAVQESGGEVRALLAGQREGALLRPVGWPGADFQGPICAPGSRMEPLGLLADGVRAFAFDHLLGPAAEFEPWIEGRQASPFLDVTGGLEGYLGRASKSGRDNMGQARRRLAKAERELGPVRFTAQSSDPDALGRLVALKQAQYLATGARDFFARPGRRALVDRLFGSRDADFGGVLSTLHAGPKLLAAHFGLRSGSVLHWWFPVYDPAFGAFAPGWMLLRELTVAAPTLGITRIDLGRGDDEYKRRAMTGETTVCQGMVTRSAMRRRLRGLGRAAAKLSRRSALGPGLRRVARMARNRGSRG